MSLQTILHPYMLKAHEVADRLFGHLIDSDKAADEYAEIVAKVMMINDGHPDYSAATLVQVDALHKVGPTDSGDTLMGSAISSACKLGFASVVWIKGESYFACTHAGKTALDVYSFLSK